jgi:CHASE2 domain-containing sensor protein
MNGGLNGLPAVTASLRASGPAAAMTLLVVLGILWSGAFQSLNGALYDRAMRTLDRQPERNVVIVEADGGDGGAPEWTALTEALLSSGASRVAFDFVPDGPVGSGVEGSPDVIVGLPATRGSGGGWRMADAPDHLVEGLLFAAAVLPPAQYGVHRTQHLTVPLADTVIPSLEAAAAGMTIADSASRPAFYVRFPGGADGVARVSASDVMAGRVPPALIENRVALVGRSGATGLTTPIDPWELSVDLLEFRAFAVQTLLSGRVPWQLPPALATAFAVAAILIGAALYGSVGPRHSVVAAAAVTSGLLVAGLLALGAGGAVLPVGELILSQVMLSLVIWRRQEAGQDAELARITRTIEAEAGEPEQPDLRGVATLLGVQRMLVAEPGDEGRLREVAQLDLALHDLPEPLRSSRNPAFDRMESDSVSTAAEGEDLRVVPLLREGRRVGYWFMRPAAGESLATRTTLIETLAASLAVLPGGSPERGGGADKPVDRALRAGLGALRLRLDMLQLVLDRGSAAASVRDLFGREVLASARFRELVEAAGAAASATDPVDLVRSLTGVGADRAAALLRFAIVEGRRVSVPANALRPQRMALRIAPLPVSSGTGLLFELADLAEAARSANARRLLAEQVDFLLRNDLEAVTLAASLAARPDLSQDRREKVLARLEDAVARAKARLSVLGESPVSNVVAEDDDIFPVDLVETLTRLAAEGVADEAEDLVIHVPAIMPPVLAPPRALEDLLRSVLRYLRDRGTPGAPLRIGLREGNATASVEAETEGMGISEFRLAAYLAGDREPESPELRTIFAAAELVPAWGGTFEASIPPVGRQRLVLTLKKLG